MDDEVHIRAYRATLLPDCSIEVELSLPGWDEPQVTRTDQSVDFLYLIGAEPRAIKLEGGDRVDALAREHIARHIVRIERMLRRQHQSLATAAPHDQDDW